MKRFVLAASLLAGCAPAAAPSSFTAGAAAFDALQTSAAAGFDGLAAAGLQAQPPAAPAFTRQHIAGDVYHYQLDIPVGTTANARVRVHRVVRERAPGVPVPSSHAVMLLHGDFANFVTNFVPGLGAPSSSATGLGPWLAARGVDVWGVDRRWTLPGADGDLGDFAGMGVQQELGDVALALAFARATRAVSDGDASPLVLGGFSHGAELTYAYAAGDGRGISAIAALDIYYALDPNDPDSAGERQSACANAAGEAAAWKAGDVDQPNQFFIDTGTLDRSDPDGLSGFCQPDGSDCLTNHQAFVATAGETTLLGVGYTPQYHLAAANPDGSALTFSAEDAINGWFAAAPPHSSMREQAELDAIWCGGGVTPSLAQIRVPLLYIGAAGAFGAAGLYSTTQVSSSDVTTHVVQRLPAGQEALDYGHGDLLYARDAATQAWQPLLRWLRQH